MKNLLIFIIIIILLLIILFKKKQKEGFNNKKCKNYEKRIKMINEKLIKIKRDVEKVKSIYEDKDINRNIGNNFKNKLDKSDKIISIINEDINYLKSMFE